jgi:dipeptidyl aminopeptidase/acylaminoacyl peptidase
LSLRPRAVGSRTAYAEGSSEVLNGLVLLGTYFGTQRNTATPEEVDLSSSKNVVRFQLGPLLYLSAFLFVIGFRATPYAQSKHRVTFDDLKDFQQIQSMDLSPDGNRLAYVVSWEHPELWLVDTKRGSIPRHLGKGQFPHWSPDGKHLAYYSRASGTLQLWVLDPESSHTEQITQMEDGIDPNPRTMTIGKDGWLGDPLRYSWSHDGTRLVFSSQVVIGRETAQDISNAKSAMPNRDVSAVEASVPLVLTTSSPQDWTLAGIFRAGGFSAPRHWVDGKVDRTPYATSAPITANQLFIVDIRSKAVRQLTHDGTQYFTPDWSPDGQVILCVSMEGRPLLGWGSGPTNLYEFDVATGKKILVTSDSIYKRIPSWSPDGKWITYFGASDENLGKVSLFVIPAAGGTAVNVSATLDRRLAGAYWLSDSRSVAVNYWDGVNFPIAQLSIPRGDFQVISGSGSASRSTMSVSRSDTIAWSQSDASGPAVIHVLRNGERDSYVLVDLNPEIKEFELGTQEVVRWKNGHGDDMEGVMIKPVGYQEGRRYPLIVDAYPKQQNGFMAWPMAPGQAWASREYVVFYPNGDGPHDWENPWKSITNNTRAKGVKGVDVAVDDVISGVNELIRRGIVDPEHMGLYGFSNGGAVVNQVVTKTNRFKCAISVAAATSADWSMLFFFRSPSKSIAHMVGVLPWESPQTYVDLSAVYRLDKVTTPMLLADGDNDSFFLLGEIEMYNGLRYLGKDVTLLRYPNQGHGFEGAAMKDFWERENAFLDRYLKPQPAHNLNESGNR